MAGSRPARFPRTPAPAPGTNVESAPRRPASGAAARGSCATNGCKPQARAEARLARRATRARCRLATSQLPTAKRAQSPSSDATMARPRLRGRRSVSRRARARCRRGSRTRHYAPASNRLSAADQPIAARRDGSPPAWRRSGTRDRQRATARRGNQPSPTRVNAHDCRGERVREHALRAGTPTTRARRRRAPTAARTRDRLGEARAAVGADARTDGGASAASDGSSHSGARISCTLARGPVAGSESSPSAPRA